MSTADNTSQALQTRRQFLVAALSRGALIGGLGWQTPGLAGWFDRKPKPIQRSVYSLKGQARLDGKPITHRSVIPATGRIEVDTGSELIFAVGDSAYVLREKSVLSLQGKALFVRSMKLITGGVLSVFGRRRPEQSLQAYTRTAVLGIRGTGFYLTAEEQRSYVCNCYGDIQLSSAQKPQQNERLLSKYHDTPRWVYAPGTNDGPLIQPATFLDHDDLELMTIEAIVGREVPFFVPHSGYGGPRRDY